MRDPELFSPEKVWTAEESRLADLLLQTIRAHPDKEDEAVVRECAKQQNTGAMFDLMKVWKKLQEFPHLFEVAAARGTLMDFDLNGQRKLQNKLPTVDGRWCWQSTTCYCRKARWSPACLNSWQMCCDNTCLRTCACTDHISCALKKQAQSSYQNMVCLHVCRCSRTDPTRKCGLCSS